MKYNRRPRDPAFAAEMEAIADERRRQREEANEEFRIAWAKRLETGPPLPPPFTSKLHQHKASCWAESNRTQFNGIWIRARRCKETGVIEEVTK